MTKLRWAALLALPLFAMPSPARAWFGYGGGSLLPPAQIDAGINGHFDVYWGGCRYCGVLAAPWYTYWPYEAHFQTPAPALAFPFWPGAPTAAPAYPSPASAAPQQLPAPQPSLQRQTAFQPMGYSSQAPSYWYGR